MTGLERIMRAAVNGVMSARWTYRRGRVVPAPRQVLLAGGVVELDATILYADLAESSGLSSEFDRRIAAKAVKAFLTCACRLIDHHKGEVVSFDGDRVMGAFMGVGRTDRAVKAALRLNTVVKSILTPSLLAEFITMREAGFELRHAVGIDSGTSITVRTGLRAANDLIWVGRPPNLAARLSELREPPHSTFISSAVYYDLPDELKRGPSDEQVWERRAFKWRGEDLHIYRSSWTHEL